MKKLLGKENLHGRESCRKMDKKVSLSILNECINWLQNASDVEIDKMRDIYREEKEKFFSSDSDIELLLSTQVGDSKFFEEEEDIDIPSIKVKTAIDNKAEMRYCNKEFNDANISEWEDFAAQENKVKESRFKFKNPVLESVIFGINENFNEEEYEGVEISGITKVKKRNGKNEAMVEFTLEIGEKSSTVPFYIDLTMKAEFKWTNDMRNEMLDKLLKANAPSLLLSYMRPIVANLTGSSKFPMFNIPYMDMSENEVEFEELVGE